MTNKIAQAACNDRVDEWPANIAPPTLPCSGFPGLSQLFCPTPVSAMSSSGKPDPSYFDTQLEIQRPSGI
jgi:hypothetical protein